MDTDFKSLASTSSATPASLYPSKMVQPNLSDFRHEKSHLMY